jgi:putative SOS response-associated peptidase YedK
MCGRSSLTVTEKQLEERFGATFYSDDLERYNPLPNFNVAPTHRMPIILNTDTTHFNVLRWGLIPFWAKDEKVGYKMINARLETLDQKPSFKTPLAKRRCLVPMDAFYEWKREGKLKIPYRIFTTDQAIFSVAGLWESWRSPTGEIINSYTVITQAANEMVGEIHDRMPAILPNELKYEWLNNDLAINDLLSLISPYPSENMAMYQVSQRLNNVRENDISLLNKAD